MVEPKTLQMAIQRLAACWLSKATRVQACVCARAPTPTHTRARARARTHALTEKICNT